jgi:uncharacterized surface protein with fasciclin (FAS1) repeats
MWGMKKVIIITVMFAVLLGMTAPTIMSQTAYNTASNTILQNLGAMPQFSNIANLAKSSGVANTLNGATQYTVFAPTNNAVAKIPSDSVKAILGNQPLASNLVNYHVVPGVISYSNLLNAKQLTTVDGRTLPVTVNNGVVSVGGARVLTNGIVSKNGVIYPIDSVMLPPGFTMPQVSRSTGMSWGWLPWLAALIVLGGLAYYLLTRKHKAPEVPRGRYAPAETRRPVVEKTVEEPRRADDTMRQVRESVSTVREPSISDITKNVSLPLSGDALSGLNMLIDKGAVKDKQDFLGFLAKSYMQNNLGSAIGSSGGEPGISTVMDIINKTGIAKGFMEGDVKKFIVPLMMTGIMAIYNYLNKRPAVKTT